MSIIELKSVAQNTHPLPKSKSNAGSFSIEEDRYCLVPDGEYLVALDHYRTDHMFKGAPKLEMMFGMIDEGYQGLLLPKWYNAKKAQKNRKYGNFKVARRSNFSMDFMRLFDANPKRLDRIPMSLFENHLFMVETEQVKHNFQQANYPERLKYSKIKRIIKAIPM